MQLPHVRFSPAALSSSILWTDILTSHLFSATLTLAFSLIILSQNFKKTTQLFLFLPLVVSLPVHAAKEL
jgi:hypothetical protein